MKKKANDNALERQQASIEIEWGDIYTEQYAKTLEKMLIKTGMNITQRRLQKYMTLQLYEITLSLKTGTLKQIGRA